MAKRTAIIDIGSNSIRMVIYQKTSRFAFYLLHEAKFRVRLSENAYINNGNLQDKAMQRTYNAIQAFLYTIKQYKASKTLCVATSAIRDAPNKDVFISRVKKELKLNIKIIDGNKEAYLGGIAAANLLYLKNSVTIDIGGGSTELAIYKDRKVIKTISLNLGTVRLKELFFDSSDINGAKKYISNELDKLSDDFISESIIGIGGTLRALSKIIMEKENVAYKKLHGFLFKTSAQADYLNKILLSNEKELKKLGVKDERLDVIKPGVLIISLLIKRLQAKKIISSGVGLREGLFLSDLLRSQADKFPHNYNISVKALQDRFMNDTKSSFYSNSSKLFDLIHLHLNIKEKYKHEFLYAIKLSQIGKQLDFYDSSKHAYNILLHGLKYDFTHKQVLLISTLVRFQDRKPPNSTYLDKYTKYLPKKDTTLNLSFIISLSKVLYEHNDNKLSLKLKNNSLYIKTDNSYIVEEKLKQAQTSEFLNLSVIPQ